MLRARRSGDDCTHPHNREGPGTPEAGGSEEREDTGRNTTGGCKIGGNSSLEFKLDKKEDKNNLFVKLRVLSHVLFNSLSTPG